MIKNDCYIGSINPSANAFFRTNKVKYGSFFCVGSYFYLIINKDQPSNLMGDEDEMEDYHRTLLYLQFYKKTYRNDMAGVRTKYEGNKGGMGTSPDRYLEKTRRSKELLLLFPNLCRLNVKAKYTGLIIANNNNKILSLPEGELLAEVDGEVLYSKKKLNRKLNYFIYHDDTEELIAYLYKGVFTKL